MKKYLSRSVDFKYIFFYDVSKKEGKKPMDKKPVSEKNNIFDLMDSIKEFLEYMQIEQSDLYMQTKQPDSKYTALKEIADRSWIELDKRLMNIKDAILRNAITLKKIEDSAEDAEEENEEAHKEADPYGHCPLGQRRPPRD